MERIKLFIKTIVFSFKLTFASSKLMVLLTFLLMVLNMIFPFLSLYITKNIFDELVKATVDMSVMITYILLFIGLIIICNIVAAAANITSKTVSEKTAHAYDTVILEKISKTPMEIIDSSAGRDILDELRQVGYSINSLPSNIIVLISTLVSLCIAIGILMKLNVWFLMLFLAASIPGIIFEVFMKRKIEDLRRKTTPDIRKFSYYRWMLTDAWPAKDVRMYDLTDPIKTRYKEERDKYVKENKRLDIKHLLISFPIKVICRSGVIIFTVFIILQAFNGEITIGDISLYIGTAGTVSSSIITFLTTITLWFTAIVDRMKILFDFLSMYSPEDRQGKRVIDKFESLEFIDVYFKYPSSEQYVLKGVSFRLEKGDKLSIVGINGAGKSTIIKVMLGFYQIESGKILINGNPMEDYSMKEIRKMFTVLFQNYVQYPLTLRENIALSCIEEKDNDEKIITAMKQSGFYNESKNFSNGFDVYMSRQFDDEGIEVSKGQWQKIALSRAYFKNADIIIFDEPSSALDAEAEEKIFQNFSSISKERTGIMISHRISSSKISNKIIVLDEGKIIESGTHPELIAFGGLYAKLYNLQMKKYTMTGGDLHE